MNSKYGSPYLAVCLVTLTFNEFHNDCVYMQRSIELFIKFGAIRKTRCGARRLKEIHLKIQILSLTLKLFQIYMSFFLLLNMKIFWYFISAEEINTYSFVTTWGEKMLTEFSFLGDLFLLFFLQTLKEMWSPTFCSLCVCVCNKEYEWELMSWLNYCTELQKMRSY